MAATASKVRMEMAGTDNPTIGIDNVTATLQRSLGALSVNPPVSGTNQVSEVWNDQIQLSAGTVSFDLTALTNGNLAATDLTGLKVQGFHIKAASANTADILVAGAAATPYELLGTAAANEVELGPGDQIMRWSPESLADVSASVKDVTVTSSDVDAIFDILILAG
jgi:hypothetical protein